MNNVTNSQPDQDLQRDLELRLELERNSQVIVAERRVQRPRNTEKLYTLRQAEWKTWCINQGFSDGVLVNDSKLSYFLREFIVKRGRKNRANPDGTPIPLGRESIYSYVKACMDLGASQHALGFMTEKPVRGPLVIAFLETLDKKETKRKRESHHDRGVNTLNDCYTREQYLAACCYFMRQNSTFGTRNRLLFMISHAMLLRSETALGMQLADLLQNELNDQGVSQCIALVATITFGKTNQDGKTEYGSALRHNNVELCPIGALAVHLFSRFHFENETFPDFSSRKSWYDTYLFNKKGSKECITYDEQVKIYKEAFEKIGINSSKVTHINRKSALNMMSNQNVPSDQQRMAGRWSNDRMVGSYVVTLPVQAIKVLAGFTVRDGDYFLARSVAVPPVGLENSIFPEIEAWQAKFDAKEIEKDIAGTNFLMLMRYLRRVLLQDSVLLKQKYPDNYLWTCPVFATEEYSQFERQSLASILEDNQKFSINHQLENLMPEVANTMKTGFNSLATSLKVLQAQIDSIENKVNSTASAQQSDMRTVTGNIAELLMHTVEQLQNQPGISSVSNFPMTLESSPALTAPISVDEASGANHDDEPHTNYRMNRNLVTVTDAWREYDVGLVGGPSIRFLEERYGTGWRKDDRRESRFLSRRMVVIREVERLAARDGVSGEQAAAQLEMRRVESKISLDKLRKLVSKEN